MTQPQQHKEPDALPSVTIKVPTPDGTMYVTIVTWDNIPYRIDLNIGKAGTTVQAWANAVSRLVTLCLRTGMDIYQVIEELSEITSSRVVYWGTRPVKSGPDGISQALISFIAGNSKSRPDNKYIGATFG